MKRGLQDMLRALPVLRLSLRVDGEPRVGRQVVFQVRIKNISDDEQTVVRSVHMSDWGVRYPRFVAQILDDKGRRPEGLRETLGYRGTVPIKPSDLRRLKPGEEFDPLEGSDHLLLGRWQPREPGTYTVKLVADYAPANASDCPTWPSRTSRTRTS